MTTYNPNYLWTGRSWNVDGSGAYSYLQPTTLTYSYLTQLPLYYYSTGNVPDFNNPAHSSSFTPDTYIWLDWARNSWSAVANITWAPVTQAVGPGASESVGNITFGYYRFTGPNAGAQGVGWFPGADQGTRAGDVFLNRDVAANLDVTAGTVAFETLLHEVGHALGLDHSGAPILGGVATPVPSQENSSLYTVMSYNAYPWGYAITPMVHDIVAIQRLYGVNTSTNAGQTVYQFTPTSHPLNNITTGPFDNPGNVLMTLWDGDGMTETASGQGDKIDASTMPSNMPVFIDLRPGEYSSIGTNSPFKRNVGIAFGTIIEDATGGAGNDEVRGNAAANRLEGGPGAGNDVLDGGGADGKNDTLIGGAGNDDYALYVGGGIDTIVDNDGIDWIFERAPTGERFALNRVSAYSLPGTGSQWTTPDGRISFTLNSPLTITDNSTGLQVIIEGWQPGDFGIHLKEIPSDPQAARNFTGDREFLDADPGTPGIQPLLDAYGNAERDPATAVPDRQDTFFGSDDTQTGDLFDTRGGDDTLYARAGADWLKAGAGRDWAEAGGGDDLVEGGAGADILLGGAGKDRVYAQANTSIFDAVAQGNVAGATGQGDWLSGGEDDDVLIGGEARDVLTGGPGEDLLVGGGGDDNLLGDADYIPQSFGWSYQESGGNRVFLPVTGEADPVTGGADTLYGGGGEDFLRGGRGDDSLAGEDGADDLAGEAGDDVVVGGSGNDAVSGDASYVELTLHGRDFLDGGAGEDELYGGGGADTLLGDAGRDSLLGDPLDAPAEFQQADVLDGGAGEDLLLGAGGEDTLLGGSENDVLLGGAGADALDGGAGDDLIAGEAGADVLTGGAGADTFVLTVGAGADTITDLSPEDTLFFEDAVSPYGLSVVGNSGPGGTAGPITLRYGDAGDLVGFDPSVATLSFALGGASYAGAALASFLDGIVRELASTDEPDTLIGASGPDALDGGGGDDWLEGRAGADTLDGGEGADRLNGGSGEDLLLGGAGDDIYLLRTGDGADTIADALGANRFHFEDLLAAEIGAAWRDNGDGTERLELYLGTRGDSVMLDQASVAALAEVEFADGSTLDGAGFVAQALAHRVVLDGTPGDDVLNGTPASDVLNGLAGADTLLGGEGADTLAGDAGADRLAGGAGADTYLFGPDGGADRIEDAFAEGDTVRLTGALRLADFAVAAIGADLALVAEAQGTSAILAGFFRSDLASKSWTILGDQDPATDLRVWAIERIAAQAQAALEARLETARTTFLNAAAADLEARGRAGDSLGDGLLFDPTSPYVRYQFTGVSRTSVTTDDAVLELPSSESGSASFVEEPRTFSFQVTQYRTLFAPPTVVPAPFLYPLPPFGQGNGVSVILVDGRNYFVYPGAQVQVATGTLTEQVTQSVFIQEGVRAFTLQEITAGDGANRILAFEETVGSEGDIERGPVVPFRGSIRVGAGDDEIDLGGTGADDWWEGPDAAAFGSHPRGLGAFLDGGAGADRLTGTDANDELYGGAGDDFLDGGRGADTYYALFAGEGTDVLYDSGDPGNARFDASLYGGVFPQDTLVFDAGVTLANLQYRHIAQSSYDGRPLLEISWGTDSVLRLVYEDSPDSLEPAAVGIERFRLADGTVLSRTEFLAQVEALADNQAPTLALPLADLSIEERAAFVWALPAGSFADADPGDVLQYAASLAGGGPLPTWLAFDPFAATLSGTPGESDIGAYAIRIRAADAAGAFAEDEFTLAVTVKPGQSFTGTGSANTIAGTDGADTVHAGGGADTVYGYARRDALYGEAAEDLLYGGSGDDSLDGAGGADRLYGEDGDDTLLGGSGNDEAWGGAGADRLWGGDNADSLHGEAGDDSLYGEDGNDELFGGTGQDYLSGGANADALAGEDGTDLLQAGAGNDTLLGGAGNDLLDPGANADSADGGDGADLLVAGGGPDTFATGAGADLIAYNRGDGQDVVNAGSGGAKSVSLGGGIAYADLALRKSANDLVLETGGSESLTFKNWYAATPSREFVTLQVIAEAMAGYDPQGADPLRNRKVQTFDFAALTGAFDAARAADALLSRWALMDALLDAHLAASDDAALGGDLAYQYGANGTLAGIGSVAAQEVLGAPQFGVQAQQLRPLASLQGGPATLG